MGLKVLEQNEGPKNVLATSLSRFTHILRFIVYDLGCSLFSSAVHTFRWALEDTAVLTDNIHAVNRTCSPSYLPSLNKCMTLVNTISHEQGNRRIKELSKTLRFTSQQT